MEGRLVPPEPGHFQAFPVSRWRDEFELAAKAGLDSIEWIYDVYGENENPLASDDGLREMQELQSQHGVEVVSVCADWFMANPLQQDAYGTARDRLAWLLERCSRAGIRRAVLPFVDDSRMRSDDEHERVREVLVATAPAARDAGVELHIESDLEPASFAAFVHGLPSDVVRINYDSGNSSSLGYDSGEEFAAYGEWIGSFHVKDRVRGGRTVPLGEGDADLPAVFDGLRALGYDGDVILQVARTDDGRELAWARHNAKLVRRLWG
jgi:L-ribulose-5-phosphate 3-epimerase